jgi:sigma54-dependent transcription regulator
MELEKWAAVSNSYQLSWAKSIKRFSISITRMSALGPEECLDAVIGFNALTK